jgi:hypothetical protein
MKTKYSKGYSIWELLLFLATITAFIAVMTLQIIELKGETKLRKRLKIVTKLEVAKNMYDTTANKDARTKFDGSNDEARFDQLAPLLEAKSAIAFVEGAGIGTLKVNRLGENVEIVDETRE